MELSKSTGKQEQDRFLNRVVSNAFAAILFLVGMAMIGSASGSGAMAVGLAAAAGSASVAYIAKLVISARTKNGD